MCKRCERLEDPQGGYVCMYVYMCGRCERLDPQGGRGTMYHADSSGPRLSGRWVALGLGLGLGQWPAFERPLGSVLD